MIFTPATISGMYTVTLEPHEDARGSFARAYAREEFERENISFRPVQMNQARTIPVHTLRGLHWQIAPKLEAKLFQCLAGSVFDVVADVRPDSPTFGKWQGTTLQGSRQVLVYIPAGVAHGYETLEENCLVQYLVSEFYSPGFEKGLRWNDPFFDIAWPFPPAFVSPKDSAFPDFKS